MRKTDDLKGIYMIDQNYYILEIKTMAKTKGFKVLKFKRQEMYKV